jgi:hypothetical protein
MPTEQLDAIEQRCADATSGEWGWYDGGNYADVVADYKSTGWGSYSCRQQVAHIEADWSLDDSEHEDWDESQASEQACADAEFIAHSRQDVPALVAEVRRLAVALATEQAAHEDTHTTLASYRRIAPQLQQHTEKAQAEAAALAADLATARARIDELESLAGRCGNESRGRRCDQPAGHGGDHQALGGSSVSYVWASQ